MLDIVTRIIQIWVVTSRSKYDNLSVPPGERTAKWHASSPITPHEWPGNQNWYRNRTVIMPRIRNRTEHFHQNLYKTARNQATKCKVQHLPLDYPPNSTTITIYHKIYEPSDNHTSSLNLFFFNRDPPQLSRGPLKAYTCRAYQIKTKPCKTLNFNHQSPVTVFNSKALRIPPPAPQSSTCNNHKTQHPLISHPQKLHKYKTPKFHSKK